MKFYTERYFIQETLEGHPSVRITCSEPSHWICAQWRESLGRNGHEHHLVDNYGATFVCRVLKNDSGVTIEPGTNMKISNGIHGVTELHFEKKLIYLYPLPDHAIDVLQTTVLDVNIETLRRIAVEFAKRSGEFHRIV